MEKKKKEKITLNKVLRIYNINLLIFRPMLSLTVLNFSKSITLEKSTSTLPHVFIFQKMGDGLLQKLFLSQ